MNTMRGMAFALRKNTSVKFRLPLMTLVIVLAASSAASGLRCAAQLPKVRVLQQRRVVARGRLTGTRELQQIVTWQTLVGSGSKSVVAHFAIETTGAKPRTLWEADDRFTAIDISAVRTTDLDGDGLAEIICLWCHGASVGCSLRIFHWDRRFQTFVELPPKGDDEVSGTSEVQRYRVVGRAAQQRIIVYRRAPTGWPVIADGEYMVRSSELVRVRGGRAVTAQQESGIEGRAVISPVRPGPVREGQSDTASYKTTLVVRSAGGSEVKRLETGSDGRFRVVLPPGTYRVGPPQRPGRFLPRAGEEIVTVAPGKFTYVTIEFESGMR